MGRRGFSAAMPRRVGSVVVGVALFMSALGGPAPARAATAAPPVLATPAQPLAEPANTLSGTVTNGSTGVAGITVSAVDEADASTADQTTSGPGGTWLLKVPDGTYAITFSDPSAALAPGCLGTSGYIFDDSRTVPPGDSLRSLSVTSSTTLTDLNVALPQAFHIAGTVTDTQANRLAGITAHVVLLDELALCAGYLPKASTNSAGEYSVIVPAGNYCLRFEDPAGNYAGGNYVEGGLAYDRCEPISVGPNDVSGIDVSLPAGHRIGGTLTHDGMGIAGVQVQAVTFRSALIVDWTLSGSDGAFTLTVAPGVYQLTFRSTDYAPGIWDGTGFSPGGQLGEDGYVVAVNSDVGGINADLPLAIGKPTGVTAVARDRGATVSWTPPTEDGGRPIVGYEVVAIEPVGVGKGCIAWAPATSCVVTGLNNGQGYAFVVVARTNWFSGPSSDPAYVRPSVLAGQPRNIGATPGNSTATITWEAPTDVGGLTSYSVVDSTGNHGCFAEASATSCLVAGLTNRTTYSFTVTAHMGTDAGPASDPALVTPATPPAKVTDVLATAYVETVEVRWSAPDDGGNRITGYTVMDQSGTHTCATTMAAGFDGTPTSCYVRDLTPGQSYSFSVIASNQIGPGEGSNPSNAVVLLPEPTVPGKPTGVKASAGNGWAWVTWTPSTFHGSAVHTQYTVTSSPPSAGCISPDEVACLVLGLTNGTPYTFRVSETNTVGTGPESDPSNQVIPTGAPTVPGKPTGVTAVKGDGSATVSWSAPAFNGGATISHYAVTSNPTSAGCATTGATTCQVTGLTNGTPYTFRVSAANIVGSGEPSDPSAAVPPASSMPAGSSTFVPLPPARILDTRVRTGITTGPLRSHVADSFMVWGQGGVPAGATAVTGNLTVTGQTSLGFFFIGPSAANSPTSSTLNFPKGDDRANAVTVALSSEGKLWVTYAAPTLGPTADAIFDVTGYFKADMNGATYHALDPGRILDTRMGNLGITTGPLRSHIAQSFAVWGQSNVPAGARAVTGNLTVTGQTSLGYLSIGPDKADDPTSSTLNFPLGDDRANAVTVALSTDGKLWVTYAAPRLGPTAHAIFDVTGYFTDGGGGSVYVPLAPTRLLDSRDRTGGLGIFSSHAGQGFTVAGAGGVPSTATAVTGNLTVTQQSNLGFLYVGPQQADKPTSSTLNFPVADDRANAVTVAVGADGKLWVTYAAPIYGPTAHGIFDVTGYFIAP